MGSKIEFPSNNSDESNSNLDTVRFIASANLSFSQLKPYSEIFCAMNPQKNVALLCCCRFWGGKTHRKVDPGDTRSSPFATICSKCAPYLGVENDTHGQLSINCTLKKTKVVTLLYEKCAILSETSVSVMSEWHTKGMANSHTSVAHAFPSSRQCNLWRNDKNGRFSDLVVKRKLGHVRPLVCSGKAGSSGSAFPHFTDWYGICWDLSPKLISVALPTSMLLP